MDIKELQELKEAMNKLYLANNKKEMALSYCTYSDYLENFFQEFIKLKGNPEGLSSSNGRTKKDRKFREYFPELYLKDVPDFKKIATKDKRFRQLFQDILYKDESLSLSFLDLKDKNNDIFGTLKNDDEIIKTLESEFFPAKFINNIRIEDKKTLIKDFFDKKFSNSTTLVKEQEVLFVDNNPYPNYSGWTLINYLNNNKKVIVENNLFPPIESLTTIVHELGHVIDLTDQQKRFNNYEILNSLSSPCSEIVSTYCEKLFIDYLMNNSKLYKDAKIYEIENIINVRKRLSNLVNISSLPNEVLESKDFLNTPYNNILELARMYNNKNCVRDKMNIDINFTDDYQDCYDGINEDILYGYGKLYSLVYSYYKKMIKRHLKR